MVRHMPMHAPPFATQAYFVLLVHLVHDKKSKENTTMGSGSEGPQKNVTFDKKKQSFICYL